jgi:hypothetical protein
MAALHGGTLTNVERTLRLEGPGGLGAKPRPELIAPVLAHVHGTLQDAVRMGFLHSSRARGRLPQGIRAASDVRYVGHAAGDADATLLRFEVRTFGEAAADYFAQARLWEDGPQPDETAFELLAAALDDVRTRRAESNRYDLGMLRSIRKYRGVFRKDGLVRIAMPDVARQNGAQLDPNVLTIAQELAAVTPLPRRVRVAGRLDLMGASQGVLKLHVDSGVVTALWQGEEPLEELAAQFFNRDVLCEGLGVFRASGSLLRIDADAIRPANEQADAFRHVPSAVPKSDFARAIRIRQGEPSAYASFLGSVPAEESDEAFARAIEAMS